MPTINDKIICKNEINLTQMMQLNYHTYREICQQPEMWLKAYKMVCDRKAEIKAFVERYISAGYSIVLTGAGTSAYIGDALEKALYNTSFAGCRSIPTTDIITSAELFFNKESKVLLVSFARSGNSPESVGTINLVNKVAGEVAHIFITCNEQGELAKMAAASPENTLLMLLPKETNDLSLAMTSSYSTMLLTCSMIANIDSIEAHADYIRTMAENTAKAIEKYEGAIKEIASRPFKRAVFLGSGELQGIAEESRLKLQELTDGSVMCAFDSFLGFRHGPKAVIDKDTLLVYLLSEEPKVQRYEYDLIRQIRANNNIVGYVAISQTEPKIEADYFDLSVVIGAPTEEHRYYSCVSYVVASQLLGMFKSIDMGLSPDAPSVSGNISRVVEGVIIYED